MLIASDIDNRRLALADVVSRGFVFTDLVGSTALAEELGDRRFAALLAAHNAAVREAADPHGVRSACFLGDGFMLVLPNARAALDCARDVQRAIERLRGECRLPLQVRIGVNAGTAVLADGEYVGRNVILARRLCEEAAPGEVLVAEHVRAAAGHSAERMGPPTVRRFKGIAAVEPACALDWCFA
jgi:adenylate cyclase